MAPVHEDKADLEATIRPLVMQRAWQIWQQQDHLAPSSCDDARRPLGKAGL